MLLYTVVPAWSISVVVQFCRCSVKQAGVIIMIRKFQWKSCFTSTHTCTSFKIISPSSGLAKKAFPIEMKCRKCPAKEKGSEEGSKTYWAILSFPHAWIWEAVMWYIIQHKQFMISCGIVLKVFASFWPYSGQPENDLTQHMLQISFENRLLIYPKLV